MTRIVDVALGSSRYGSQSGLFGATLNPARTWTPRRVFCLCLAAMVVAATPAEAQVLNQAQDFYRTTTQGWLGPMEAIARRLFVTLAGLEIAISGLLWTLRRDSLDQIATKFLIKFIVLSFVLLLITGAGVWLRPIVNGIAAAGQFAGVVPPPSTPSEVMNLGEYVAFSVISTDGMPIALSSFAAIVFALFTRIVVFLSFAAVAVILILAWVEAYIGLAGGVLFLGLGGFRGTAQYAENYLNYLVYLGVRLFAVYLLLTIGTTIVNNFIPPTLKAATPDLQGQVAVISMIFAVLTVRIPSNLSSRIASGANFGLVQALRSL